MRFRRLELNGGHVIDDACKRLILPPTASGYADAQIDDYGLVTKGRKAYPWHPRTILRLRARFSHPVAQLRGTAGFGFWNAPFGDPTVRWPALPQAAWFFFASEPTDLPLAPSGPGRGWFASTMDASQGRALAMIPLAPAVLLFNQFACVRQDLWPKIQTNLGISFAPINVSTNEWHEYELLWMTNSVTFSVDDVVVLKTLSRPAGPLGFVCWIDNQYLVATANGRIRWGTISTTQTQWLEIEDLMIAKS